MALKLYSAAAATDYEQLREMIDNEIAVHSSLCHPHILRFYGAFREDDYLALVLQLAPQGDLLGVMGRIPRDEHTVSRLIAAPLLSALAYLHGRGLVHRDIKPENVFVDDSDVFLGDFGFARSQRRGTLRSAVGTVHFMAPEILRNTLEGGRWGDYVPRDERVPYGPEVDVWSLGVVLYELLTRRLPFTGDSQQSVCDAVLAGPPPLPKTLSSLCLDFLSRMLTTDPARRATSRELLTHPFILAHISPVSVRAGHVSGSSSRGRRSLLGCLGSCALPRCPLRSTPG